MTELRQIFVQDSELFSVLVSAALFLHIHQGKEVLEKSDESDIPNA